MDHSTWGHQQQQQQQQHHQQQQRQQAPNSSRSNHNTNANANNNNNPANNAYQHPGNANTSAYSQASSAAAAAAAVNHPNHPHGPYGTINPNYRQAQSYNPSPTGPNHLASQIHDAYKRVEAVPSSTRDVYSARSDHNNNVTTAPAQQAVQDVPTTTPASNRPAPKRSRAKKAAATSTGATNAGDVTTATTNPTPGTNSLNPAQANASTTSPSTNVPSSGGGATSTSTTGQSLPFDTKPLYTRLEQLTKTHTDLITYLHAELDRRRDWEEMMVKEMHQRHSVLLTLITTLVPVTNSSGIATNRALLSSDLSSTIGRAGLPGMPAVSAMGSMSNNNNNNKNDQDVSMGGDIGGGGAFGDDEPHDQQAGTSSSSSTRPPPGLFLPGFNLPRSDVPSINISQPAGYTQTMPNSPAVNSLKRHREEDPEDFLDGNKDANIEVDERGIIYMAGGRKTGLVPTKIASLVRKSLYAAQGVPTGKIQLPLYVNGMYPANGDEHWAFGNVRFDWNSTTKKSGHNAEMKRIVIEHIVSHRYAYPEIPESEFTGDRLDHSYEQSFNNWKAKFHKKKPSGIKKTKSIGSRELQKILDVVGTGREKEAGLTGSQVREVDSARA